MRFQTSKWNDLDLRKRNRQNKTVLSGYLHPYFTIYGIPTTQFCNLARWPRSWTHGLMDPWCVASLACEMMCMVASLSLGRGCCLAASNSNYNFYSTSKAPRQAWSWWSCPEESERCAVYTQWWEASCRDKPARLFVSRLCGRHFHLHSCGLNHHYVKLLDLE